MMLIKYFNDKLSIDNIMKDYMNTYFKKIEYHMFLLLFLLAITNTQINNIIKYLHFYFIMYIICQSKLFFYQSKQMPAGH